jgi:hypothetical protein
LFDVASGAYHARGHRQCRPLCRSRLTGRAGNGETAPMIVLDRLPERLDPIREQRVAA